MKSLKELSTFDVTIQGRVFTMLHRCTALMVLIGDVRRTLGQLAEISGKELTPEQAEETMRIIANHEMKTLEIALVKIDGESIEVVSHEVDADALPAQVYTSDLIHVAPVLAKAFNESGLQADPLESSCVASQAPN